ncbi:MAG: hypothetical protein JWN77_311 [Frankiales bacterium]|jgi:hypothetical protein|nr:hypothetical protein [Frankiales bacterium]
MTRRQWTGAVAIGFGVVMFVGVLLSGTTPDNGGSGAVDRYTKYWSDDGHQTRALTGTIVLTYAWVLLAVLAALLRHLLGGQDGGPHRAVVLAAGTAAAALFGVGSVLVNGSGVAAAQASGYRVDGNDAMFLESTGYVVLTTAMMMAAAMALAFSLANRRARLVPAWTLVLTGLLVLVGLGNIATAWAGFMVLPLWAVVTGACLLLGRESAPAASALARESAPA